MKSILSLGLLVSLLAPLSVEANGILESSPAYDETMSADMESIMELDSTATERGFYSSPEDIHRAKVVIIINKASAGSTAQLMRVYVDGELTYEWKVSTGREKVEKAKSGRVYLTTTPVGYFRPTRLVANYHSNTWKADMPHAVFFIGGVAIHASTHIEQLGQRASGGCVRLSPKNARTFFNLVQKMKIENIDRISKNGTDVKDQKGNLLKTANRDVLIIVENRI
jgi:hypothetical protein